MGVSVNSAECFAVVTLLVAISRQAAEKAACL